MDVLSRFRFPALLPGLLLCLLVAPLELPAQEIPDPWADWPDEEESSLSFDDSPLEEEVRVPAWFRLSFLDLREDLADAVAHRRKGLIVYFGQKYCPYCKKLMEVNFGKRDIVRYTRKHFDVVAIDIYGDRTVTDLGGNELSEKAFAERENTNFTPSLIFYDAEGEEALRLRGYHPPYQFRAALEYVADGHYRRESFRSYLERADPPLAFEIGGLNEAGFFSPAPYALDRSRIPAENPLIVFFEQGDCHACDVLHSEPLQEEEIRELLGRFDSVQLDMWAQTPVLTPGGKRTTARAWADELGIFYAPTLVFFDEHGTEILRVDSVVRFFRLRSVLNYILSGVWRDGVTLQRWRGDPVGD